MQNIFPLWKKKEMCVTEWPSEPQNASAVSFNLMTVIIRKQSSSNYIAASVTKSGVKIHEYWFVARFSASFCSLFSEAPFTSLIQQMSYWFTNDCRLSPKDIHPKHHTLCFVTSVSVWFTTLKPAPLKALCSAGMKAALLVSSFEIEPHLNKSMQVRLLAELPDSFSCLIAPPVPIFTFCFYMCYIYYPSGWPGCQRGLQFDLWCGIQQHQISHSRQSAGWVGTRGADTST